MKYENAVPMQLIVDILVAVEETSHIALYIGNDEKDPLHMIWMNLMEAEELRDKLSKAIALRRGEDANRT